MCARMPEFAREADWTKQIFGYIVCSVCIYAGRQPHIAQFVHKFRMRYNTHERETPRGRLILCVCVCAVRRLDAHKTPPYRSPPSARPLHILESRAPYAVIMASYLRRLTYAAMMRRCFAAQSPHPFETRRVACVEICAHACHRAI